ncbi:DUF883 domain-containing protein [Massilia arenosa]|uniref:DUF883 domain-containing protein n=1 Tax=Zemynaea arenosa TaxID=2561931 RepID=A0A4Y9RTR1_9BURK|nr:DUF883 family protein [Massilia arenosa]TFW10648.1 DUF883 domain-containing protein [Massilia arenosa]
MMQAIPTKSSAREKLMDDLRTVVSDAQNWISQGGQMTGEELAALKDKLERAVVGAKDELVKLGEPVIEKTKEVAQATDNYVHENPWKSVGIGVGVGVVIGMLLARR